MGGAGAGRELHLCGEARALPLLERLCGLCGDVMEVKEYARLSSLKATMLSLSLSLALSLSLYLKELYVYRSLSLFQSILFPPSARLSPASASRARLVPAVFVVVVFGSSGGFRFCDGHSYWPCLILWLP